MRRNSALPDEYAPPGENPRAIMLIALGTLLFLGFSIAALWVVFQGTVPEQAPFVPAVFPGPALLENQSSQRDRLTARHRAELESYAWVDRTNGIMRIPLARAMQIISSRGAGAYDPIATAGVGQAEAARPPPSSPAGAQP